MTSKTIFQLFFIVLITIISSATAAAATATTNKSSLSASIARQLDGFNSYWNGEWKADNNGGNYECNGGNCDDTDDDNYQRNRPSDMYYDDNFQQFKSEEYEIIRNVSLGLILLLMLSCCVCYPEFAVMLFNKLNCCCPGGKEVDTMGDGGGDYVGGKMSSSGGRKMKKKRSKKKESGGVVVDGLAANADVELV